MRFGDFANWLSSVTTDGETWLLSPAKMQGVVDVTVTGFNASDLASAAYLATDPAAVYTDENADETRCRHDQYRHVALMTNALNQTLVYDRDANGLLVALVDPDPDGLTGPQTAPVTSFFYCGCGSLMKIIDPLGQETEYEYDNRYRLTAVKLPSPSSDPNDSRRTVYRYAYDKLGNLLAETDALGQATHYEYDPLVYHLRKIIGPHPDGTPWAGYDELTGNPISHED